MPTSRQLAVVLNPIKVEDAVAFRAMVEQRAAETGWGLPAWYTTTVEDPGRSMAESAAISGAEMVIVCGGDGTVRTVCAELAGTGISVGIIPAGTGNLLARNLGIPLYFQAAVDVALQGQDRAIDMVKVTGDGIGDDEHFMVMAGMGFDAAIMEGANEQIKAKVGWLAYVVSGMRNIMFPAVRLEIRVDDGEWTRHRARTIVIGNVGLPAGRHAAAARRGDRRRRPRRRAAAPEPVPELDPARRTRDLAGQAHRRPGEPDDRPDGRGASATATPRASSTATRSVPGASCARSACTAGCWCASRAEAGQAGVSSKTGIVRPDAGLGALGVEPVVGPGVDHHVVEPVALLADGLPRGDVPVLARHA